MERSKETKYQPLITALKKAGFRHGYLIITAAWLYTLSYVVSNYWEYNSSPKRVQHKIQQQLNKKEERFNKIITDTALISSLINDSVKSPEKNKLIDEPFGFFIYSDADTSKHLLTYWNSNKYYTDPEDIQRNDGAYFLNHQNGSFELIKKTIRLPKQNVFVVGMLPVKWDYFIENKYLISDFDGFPDLDDHYEVSTDSTAFQIRTINGKDLFKIKLKEKKYNAGYDIGTIFLRTLAVIFLFFFINAIAIDAATEKKFKQVKQAIFKDGF